MRLFRREQNDGRPADGGVAEEIGRLLRETEGHFRFGFGRSNFQAVHPRWLSINGRKFQATIQMSGNALVTVQSGSDVVVSAFRADRFSLCR